MAVDAWKSPEVKDRVDGLERELLALQGSGNIDPHLQARIADLITRSKRISTRSPRSFKDALQREVDELNALCGRDGTIGRMDREALKREVAAMNEYFPRANPTEKEAMARRMDEIETSLKEMPAGEIGINLYSTRQALARLEEEYRAFGPNPSKEQQARYLAWKQRGEMLTSSITERMDGELRDETNMVLQQTVLSRQEVEREITSAIEKKRNLGEGGIDKYAKGWRYWTRFSRQVLGGSVGAALIGAPAAIAWGVADGASAGALTAGALTYKLLVGSGALVGGGMIGTAVMRYAPQIFSRSRTAARAEESYVRRKGTLKNEAAMKQFEQALRQNVVNEEARTTEVGKLLDKQFGGRWGQFKHALGKVLWRGSLGAALGTATSGGWAAYQNPNIIGLDYPGYQAGSFQEGVQMVGGGALREMDALAQTVGTSAYVQQGVSQLSSGVQWLYNGAGDLISQGIDKVKSWMPAR